MNFTTLLTGFALGVFAAFPIVGIRSKRRSGAGSGSRYAEIGYSPALSYIDELTAHVLPHIIYNKYAHY